MRIYALRVIDKDTSGYLSKDGTAIVPSEQDGVQLEEGNPMMATLVHAMHRIFADDPYQIEAYWVLIRTEKVAA